MIPHIPAVHYSMAQNELENELIQSISEERKSITSSNEISISNIDINDENSETLLSLTKLLSKDYKKMDESSTPILRSLLTLIINIIILILNILITVISILSGIITSIFSIIVTTIVNLLKKIFSLGELMQTLLDVLASLVTGIFSIILNVIVGILSTIKNVLVDLIKPAPNTMIS
jgi:ABC-type proline/glycine betaine transport system permease subunit